MYFTLNQPEIKQSDAKKQLAEKAWKKLRAVIDTNPFDKVKKEAPEDIQAAVKKIGGWYALGMCNGPQLAALKDKFIEAYK